MYKSERVTFVVLGVFLVLLIHRKINCKVGILQQRFQGLNSEHTLTHVKFVIGWSFYSSCMEAYRTER